MTLAAGTTNIAVGDGGVISFVITCGVSQYYTALNSISYRVVAANLKRPLVSL